TTPDTNTLTITPTHGTATNISITQNITAPAVNGGQFAQQPILELRDTYGNLCTNNSSAIVTATRHDSGSWTLTGNTTVTAANGVVTFTNLGATNEAEVNGVQIAFNSTGLTQVTSNTVSLAVAQYTVTFDSQGGSSVAAITNLTHGTTVTLPAAPTREGYTFINWNTAANGSGTTFDSSTVITGNITVYAQWIDPASIRITANPDNVKGSINFNRTFTLNVLNDTVTGSVYASDITLGNEFSTLSINSINNNSNTVTLAVSGSINTQGIGTISLSQSKLNLSTVPLIAEVVVSFNSIAYHGNGNTGGSVPTDSNLYEDGATVIVLGNTGNLVKEGYTFAGWNTQANGQDTSYTQGSAVIIGTNNLNLYAMWTAIPSGGNSSDNTGGGTGGTTPTTEATPAPITETYAIVIVNGQEQNAGKETKTTEDGKSTVIVEVDSKIIESKIEEAIKNNTIRINNVLQVPVADAKAEVVKVELTGDIVKKLEENTFDIAVKHDNIEYIIPAEEFKISKVAENLGIKETNLTEIKVEIKITKLDEKAVKRYNEVVKANGAELIFPPVSFEVVAKTTRADGTADELKISKFSNYVERVMEIPKGLDPSKITTGIVLNPDGTYSHVPTSVYQKDGKWYAKLSSLTNSVYAVIWNQVEIKSVENHWSKDTVNDMASRLIIFNPESFEPNNAITRADFAEYIVRALGLYREGSTHENKFTDVSSTADRTLAILIANEYGIVTGYPDGTFRPDQHITREEAMVMYQRAMMVTKLTGSDVTRHHKYTDFEQVSEWASSYVKAVLEAHVFNGTSTTTISPKSKLTYAEAAQAIKNLLVESKLINE
ncbi:InlB B-repeat-containing protein, partial [Alkaliphilus peptidifermentans]